jgi:hypothetical protein
MPLAFDDGEEVAPPPAAPEEPAETPARGQLLYEVLCAVVSEHDETTLMGLVEVLRTRPAWKRVPKRTQAILGDLDDRLFDVEEG